MSNKSSKKHFNQQLGLFALFILAAGFLFFGEIKFASAELSLKSLLIPEDATLTQALFRTDLLGKGGEKIIEWALIGILTFFGWLLSAAAGIFAWAADANSLKAVINGGNIYKSWEIIRDLFNMAFILVLLYTAFTIIFQVDSSNKKIILTVVLMALLVNFSFPITRFIIDVGNVLMYTIFNHLLPQASGGLGSIFVNISAESQLGEILNGTKTTGSLSQLLAAIVFTAILAITFLMMSILFVIRIVALAIIIIFSPIAFIGAAVPSMSGKTGQWWDYLFKYTFFGPAMALMIFISTQLIEATVQIKQAAFESNISSHEEGLIADMGTAAIPVVILWIGMGLANSMGIAGADMARKMGTKAFKFAALAPAKGAWWGFKKTGYPGAMKQKFDNFKKTGFLGSERVAQREAEKAGRGLFAVKGAKKQDIQRRSDEYKKNHESEDSLKQKCSTGDAAACHRLASDGDMDSPTYENFLNTKTAKDTDVMKLINGKVKEKRIDLLINYRVKTEAASLAASKSIPLAEAQKEIAKEELNKLNPDKWREQDLSNLFNEADYLAGDPEAIARAHAAYEVYNSFNDQNKKKVTENMKGKDYDAGNSFGLW